jgi:hypothetical protein
MHCRVLNNDRTDMVYPQCSRKPWAPAAEAEPPIASTEASRPASKYAKIGRLRKRASQFSICAKPALALLEPEAHPDFRVELGRDDDA